MSERGYKLSLSSCKEHGLDLLAKPVFKWPNNMAILDTQVVKVPVKAITESLKLDPEFSNRWIQMLSSEVKHRRLHCERLSLKSTRDRVLDMIQTEGTGGKYPVMTGLKSLAGELGLTH